MAKMDMQCALNAGFTEEEFNEKFKQICEVMDIPYDTAMESTMLYDEVANSTVERLFKNANRAAEFKTLKNKIDEESNVKESSTSKAKSYVSGENDKTVEDDEVDLDEDIDDAYIDDILDIIDKESGMDGEEYSHGFKNGVAISLSVTSMIVSIASLIFTLHK